MKLVPLVVLAVLVAVPAAWADVGIRAVSTREARPGDAARVTADGFLGPKPWPAMPIVMIRERQAPRPYYCGNGGCSPRMAAGRLRRSPYRLLGSIRRWQTQRDGHGAGSLAFAVPRVAPGRYVFGLFCERCVRGPTGSLIIDYALVLRVT
jgi:hypothetical protein